MKIKILDQNTAIDEGFDFDRLFSLQESQDMKNLMMKQYQ